MTDLTLDDLASGGAKTAAESAAKETAKEATKNEATGEWLVKIYDRMREDNLLMPILFGPEAAEQQPQTTRQPTVDPDPDTEPMTDDNPDNLPATVDESEPELNAETIAAICEGIEEKAGDLRISQIRTACRNRPDFVNQLIEQHADEF